MQKWVGSCALRVRMVSTTTILMQQRLARRAVLGRSLLRRHWFASHVQLDFTMKIKIRPHHATDQILSVQPEMLRMVVNLVA